MAAEAPSQEDGEEPWKYTIYLVAFPGVAQHSAQSETTFHVSEVIDHLVPEAELLSYYILGGETAARLREADTDDEEEPPQTQRGQEAGDEGRLSVPTDVAGSDDEAKGTGRISFEAIEADWDDSVSVASAVSDPFSSASIEREALGLLETIRNHARADKDTHRSRILLAGHGFGGIVVKQAIIIANTTPRYYGVTLNIFKLVFFATPHRADEKRGWEGILLDMIKAPDAGFDGQLSQILSGLVNSVSQLSHVFHKFMGKYPITNFIETDGVSTREPVIGDLGIFNNDVEHVVSCSGKDFNNILFCDIDDLDQLASLRTHFAPTYLRSQSIFEHLDRVTQAAANDNYFDALQTLSPSRWILYESRTMEKLEDFIALKEVYGSLLKGIASTSIRKKGSIQIIGPPGYGKSALLKLIAQEMTQKSPVIVIDNFFITAGSPPTLYSVHASFIYQIISQRPSLFFAVRNIMAEILGRETWTEESLRVLLKAIFQHSQDMEYLIAIYDYDDWPSEIRLWWSETLRPLLQSCDSKFIFLTSSRGVIEKLSSSKPHVLDLKKRYGKYRKNFVRAKLKSLLDRGYGSVIFGQRLTADVRKKIMTEAKTFKGSFTASSTYLVLLFQGFPLTTMEAIEEHIESSPKSEQKLYDLEVSALRTNHKDISSWIASAISLMMWSARPLRVEELAAATAVNPNDSCMKETRRRVSMDMDHDLRRHLGPIVAIENRHGRIASAAAREVLATNQVKLELQDDCKLTNLCLQYLELILEGDSSEAKSRQSTADQKVDAKDMEVEAKGKGTERDQVEDTEANIWTQCLAQVSWKDQGQDGRDTALEFLDYACRYWPTHFLRIKDPDKDIKERVAIFLLAPKIGQKWFQLYLLCHGQSSNPLSRDQKAQTPTTSFPEHVLTEPKNATVIGDNATPDSDSLDMPTARRHLAVHMACYVGLASIIPNLMGAATPASEPRMVTVRHGCTERAVVFSDTTSSYCLEGAISNDDTELVEELLLSGSVQGAQCFPLHKAALGGSLKTTQMLFHTLNNPAETDEDKKTPLHMAAAGGSANVILFLLGKDALEHELRSTDVPNMIDMQDKYLQTPVITASRMGHVEATILLVQCGADITIQDFAGRTALHYAALSCPAAVQHLATPELAHICDNDLCTPLHIAARSGNVEVTSILVAVLHACGRLHEVINAHDAKGKTPLQYAAESGDASVVNVLIHYKDDVDKSNYEKAADLAAARGHLATVSSFISSTEENIGILLLVAASGAGQLLVVQYLLQKERVSPDGEYQGLRPLCQAASKGHMEVVHALLRYKASVDVVDDRRKTPLHHAAENGMDTVVETLLAHQANVNAPDMERRTPLHSAAISGKISVIKLLLDHEANIKASSSTKGTPLHLAVWSPDAVKALLDAGADPNAADVLGQTPLHMAVLIKCSESARYLLGKNADVEARDDSGKPPLYYAITENDLPMVKELSKDRSDFDNLLTEMEWAVKSAAFTVLDYLLTFIPWIAETPDWKEKLLHDSAAGKSLEIVTLLLKLGANPNLERMGTTPLHRAATNNRVEIIRKLLKDGAEIDKTNEIGRTPLHLAVTSGSAEAVDVLLNSGAAINIQDNQHKTPVYFAAYSAKINCLKKLLEFKPDLKLADTGDWTPLHVGVDNLEATELLIGAGADPNIGKADDWTSLHLAARWGHSSIVKFLLEHGGDPNLATHTGSTGLHVAVDEHSVVMAAAMLEHGADINRRDNEMRTPIHLAIKCSDCSFDMVQLLIDHGADLKVKTKDDVSCLVMAIEKGDLSTLQVLLDAANVSSPSDAGWELEDLTRAYWKAIELYGKKAQYKYAVLMEALVKKEPKLLAAETTEGLTGLEMCLSTRDDRRSEEPLACLFVRLGTDPFARRRKDRPSALELGILSRRAPKLDFLGLCVNVSAATKAEIGFKELRIATELDKPDLWRQLAPLRDRVGAEPDQDGWIIDHFVHQAADRVLAQVASQPPRSYKTPQAFILPVLPGNDVKDRLQIEDDGLEISFSDDPDKPLCLRADFPFPPRPFHPDDSEIVYFEVTIGEVETQVAADTKESKLAPIIAIGFCGEFTDLLNAHTGWNAWSVGYHGDDGMVFENRNSATGDYDTGHTFGPGATVGCGIDYDAGEYFFTLEGDLVCRYKNKVIFRKLYPAISHRKGSCKVKVNFREDKCLWQRPRRRIRRAPTWSRDRDTDYGL